MTSLILYLLVLFVLACDASAMRQPASGKTIEKGSSYSSAFTLANNDPDMDTVSLRILQGQLWPPSDSLPGVATQAKALASGLNATCYWPNINYNDPGDRANWLTFTHLTNVHTMVQALTTPGSPSFEDPSLSSATHCALDVWLDRHFQNDNWWYSWIGNNLNLQGIYLMLSANRTSLAEQEALVKYSYDSAWWLNQWGGGANLVWMLSIQVMRGCASGNASALDQAFAMMWNNVEQGHVTNNFQGIVDDNAYHFHGQQLLSSAYGLVWLADELSFWSTATGTCWEMPSSHEAIIAQFIAEGNLELTFGSQWDFGTQGRGIDRPGLDFSWGLPTNVITSLAAQPGAAPYSDKLLYFANAVSGKAQIGRNSSKYFWTSDFLSHHRRQWGASLKMQGNNGLWKAIPNECDNSENLLAEYTGSGVLNIFSNAEPDAVKNPYYEIFPLLDWHEINGVTAEHNTPIPKCGDKTGGTWPITYTSFVGGVSDGFYSAAAFDYVSHNTSARKSYFFFDRVVVALGSNLTNNFGEPKTPVSADVWTTLVSRLVNPSDKVTIGFSNGTIDGPLPDGNRTFAGGLVDWVYAGGVGVIPALSSDDIASNASTLGVRLGEVTGNYDAIGAYSGQVNGRLFTVYLDHGNNLPRSASSSNGFAYIIAPNVTASSMPTISSSLGGVSCVTASASTHGASASDGSVAMAIFWNEGQGGNYSCATTGLNLSSNSAGLFVVTRPDQKTLRISASHPTKLGTSLELMITGVQATGSACSPGSAPGSTRVIVDLPGTSQPFMTGAPITVECAV
jgi:chondroitin AC lyase